MKKGQTQKGLYCIILFIGHSGKGKIIGTDIRVLERGAGMSTKGHREFFGVMKLFGILTMVSVIQLIFVKNSQNST